MCVALVNQNQPWQKVSACAFVYMKTSWWLLRGESPEQASFFHQHLPLVGWEKKRKKFEQNMHSCPKPEFTSWITGLNSWWRVLKIILQYESRVVSRQKNELSHCNYWQQFYNFRMSSSNNNWQKCYKLFQNICPDRASRSQTTCSRMHGQGDDKSLTFQTCPFKPWAGFFPLSKLCRMKCVQKPFALDDDESIVEQNIELSIDL